MDNNYCEYCYPEKPYHLRRKFFTVLHCFITTPIVYILRKLFTLTEYDLFRVNHFLNILGINILRTLKLITKTNHIEKNQLSASVLSLWDEAQKRQLELYNFKESKQHSLYFMLRFQKKNYYFIQTPIELVYQKNAQFDSDIKFDNKWIFKKKLLAHNLPCPQGMAFFSNKRAYHYGLTLGFPLVVKPVTASLSIHTFSNIQSPEHLKQAIDAVKWVDCQVLIEKHIRGSVYRSLIINNQLIACVMREPARVMGDGIQSIGKLIAQKNTNAPIHVCKILNKQGFNLDSIPNDGQKIFISDKVTRFSGATITNVLDQIHPDNKHLLETAHKAINIPLSGLDFICDDLSLPWHEQSFGIIENNSFPDIELHHNPSKGNYTNVASKIWDFVLKELQ